MTARLDTTARHKRSGLSGKSTPVAKHLGLPSSNDLWKRIREMMPVPSGLDDQALQFPRVLGQTLDTISADNHGIHADAAASAAGITADPIGGSSVQAIAVVDGALAEATGATPQTFATVIVRRADLPQGIANDLARPLAAHLATRLS